MKVSFTMVAILTGILFLVFIFAIVPSAIYTTGFVRLLKLTFGMDDVDNGGCADENDDGKIHLYSLGLGLSPLVGLILATELLVRWNHIEGVGAVKGTGQLLPIIVAGGGFVRVFWKVITNLMAGRYTLG
jgi:hypothetical protein